MLRFLVVLSLLVAACGPSEDPVRVSYSRCTVGDVCGLATTCAPAPIATTPSNVWVCARACTVDIDCPGYATRCVPIAGDVGTRSGWCHRECLRDVDCLDAMVCRDVMIATRRTGICVPDTGLRPCDRDGDCAPLVEACTRPDGGVDAATRGTCQRMSSTMP